MSDYEFPEELLRAKREWFAIAQQLESFPLRPWTDSTGVEHRAELGWTPELDRQETALRNRFRDLSIKVSIHPYWETLDGGVVAARMALRQEVLQDIVRDQTAATTASATISAPTPAPATSP